MTSRDLQLVWIIIIIIISGFGIYGAAVVPDPGVGNTWQRITLAPHEPPPMGRHHPGRTQSYHFSHILGIKNRSMKLDPVL